MELYSSEVFAFNSMSSVMFFIAVARSIAVFIPVIIAIGSMAGPFVLLV